MKLHCVSGEELGSYDIKQLEEYVDEAWYWYEYGSYEGSGHMIGKTTDGKWFSNSLYHCSCYGPCDRGDGNSFDTLDQLKEYLLHEEADELIAAAEATQ